MSLYYFLKDIVKLKFNYNLGKKTWFGTGGKSSIFLVINNIESLCFFLKIIPKSIPIFLIGAGSNIIIRDGGIDGITIKLGKNFKKIIFYKEKNILKVGGGVKDLDIATFCHKNSIGGFEYLRGIPGTLGGNIRMNAGCFGNFISDRLINCELINRTGKIIKLQKKEINFNYRSSSIKNQDIVLNAEFSVKLTKQKKIAKKLKDVSNTRMLSQPVNSRTGGSTFKNPGDLSAWKLIEKANFRGKKLGGANVSSKHTNFLINNGNASSLDLEILGEEIRSSVKKKFNINLDWELIRIGNFKKI